MKENETLLLKIMSLTPSLNPELRQITDFILENDRKIIRSTKKLFSMIFSPSSYITLRVPTWSFQCIPDCFD